MKKGLLVLFVAIIAVVSSCSKDAKLNRRLEGEWKTTSIDGQTMAEYFGGDVSITWKFEKEDKLTGSGSTTYSIMGEQETYPFTYTIKDEAITLTANGVSDIFSVTTYDKDKIEMVDEDGYVWVLDPK
jgi:hypothetical protein